MRRDANQGVFDFLPGLSGYLIDPSSASLGVLSKQVVQV
jgi:hypothetical protein